MTRWAAARPWLVRALTLAFVALLIFLGVRYAHTIVWQDVAHALADTPAPTLIAASALAATSHAIYSSFDLIGRAYTGHRLRAAQVLRTTFTSYAFNLNLGSLVGALASGVATLTAFARVPAFVVSELRAHSRSTRSGSIVPSASGVIRPERIALCTAVSVTPRWRA